MVAKYTVPARKPSPIGYRLTVEGYQSMLAVLDEAQQFAIAVKRRAARYPDLYVARNTLAHVFDHLARRVDEVLKHFAPISSRRSASR
jgi:hypothetical protein